MNLNTRVLLTYKYFMGFKQKTKIIRTEDEVTGEEKHILYIQIEDNDKFGNETEYWVNLEKLVELGIADKNVRNY